MKTWDDLTPEQQTFIKRHLKKGFKDIFRKREKSATNKAIIGAFGAYEDLADIFRQKAALVPDDYPERVILMGMLANAETEKGRGNFTLATRVIIPAIRLMEDLFDVLVDNADQLRGEIRPIPPFEIADADRQTIDNARQVVNGFLADDLPSSNDMTQARAAMVAYERAIDDAIVNSQDLPAAELAYEQARRLADPVIQASVAVTPADFTGAPQHGAIATAVADAGNLQNAIGRLDLKDSVLLRAMAQNLTTFANANVVRTQVPLAKTALKNASDARYAAVRTLIDTEHGVDLTPFRAEAEHTQLTTLQAEIGAQLVVIGTPFISSSRAELDARNLAIDTAARKAGELEQLRTAVATRMLKAKLTASGAQAPHQEGIIALQKVNPAAADKVIATLEGNAGTLGGMDISPDAIRAKSAEVDVLAGECNAIDKETNDARARRKAHEDEYARLNQERAQILQAGQTTGLDETQRERLREIKRLKGIEDKAFQKENALVQAKKIEYAAKYGEYDTARKARDTARMQRGMLDAVTFGPLSPDAPRPLPADMVEDVVDLFSKNADLANQTCRLAATAKDPKSMAETAIFLADRVDGGFAYQAPADTSGTVPPLATLDEKVARDYAEDILNRTAHFGAEFATGAQIAITNGVQFQINTKMRAELPTADGGYSLKNVARVRATEAAETMMTTVPDGLGGTKVKLDLNSPAFNEMLDRQKFSQDGQFQASPMLNAEMDKLKTFFADPTEGPARLQQAEDILNAITVVPASSTARDLLAQSMGIPAADFDDASKADEIKGKIQAAVLKAMVTPTLQHDVGSCFATAAVRNLKEDDPLAVMQMYADIATTGVYTPKVGTPVPAIRNVQKSDDPLTRSLEYSVASAGARLANGREMKSSNAAARAGIRNMKNKVAPATYNKVKNQMLIEAAVGFTLEYDPEAKNTGPSGDGSSELGFTRMVDIETRNANPTADAKDSQILSEADYIAYMKRKATKAAATAGLTAQETKDVVDYFDDPSFIAEVKASAGKELPWSMQFGGWGDQAGDALVGRGGSKKATRLMATKDTDTASDRAVMIVKALGTLPGTDMTMVHNSGIHAFNALPPTGDYATMMTGNVDANVKTMLVDKGAKIASTKMSKEKATYIYDKQMESYARGFSDPVDVAAFQTAFANRPDRDMTPAELETHISSQLDPMKARLAEKDVQKWIGEQTTPPTTAKIDAKRAENKSMWDKTYKNDMAGVLIEETGMPEFVIADSNWGDETNQQLFVIAPDPLTGEPRMWKKSVVGGKMSKVDEKWLTSEWYVDQ